MRYVRGVLERLHALYEWALVRVMRLEGILFDWRYGVRTAGRQEVEVGKAYQGINARHFRAAMRAINIPHGSAFIDFGSGKAKALMLASQDSRIGRAIGVEYAKALCVDAEVNAARWAGKAPLVILNGDARTYAFDGDEVVIFFNNPFDATIMRAVMSNLRASLREHPRQVWILYGNPQQGHVVEEFGFQPVHCVRTLTPHREIAIYA